MRLLLFLACCQLLMVCGSLSAAEAGGRLRLRVSWGHASGEARAFSVRLVGEGLSVAEVRDLAGKPVEAAQRGIVETRSGAGRIDGLQCVLEYPPAAVPPIENLNNIWRDLIAQSDADTARRLKGDPAYRRDPRRLIVQLDREGIRGFAVTVDQLLANRAIWVPSLDVYLSAGDAPLPFEEHQKELKDWAGQRILDQVHADDEASYSQYAARWEDMGRPAYTHPNQPAPGHIIGLTWDSAMYKFGVDRGAGVWNDYGNPDRFRFSYDFGPLGTDLVRAWRGQKLLDALPVVTTTVERDGVRYEIEQFAYPLNGPPAERRGDIAMVLLQKVRLTNMATQARKVSLRMMHERQMAAGAMLRVASLSPGVFVCEEAESKAVLFSIEGAAVQVQPAQSGPTADPKARLAIEAVASVELAPAVSAEFIVTLPSPAARAEDRDKLLAIGCDAARAATVKFWSGWLARGAQFRVPEQTVNDLYRVALWHALRLPRRHGAAGDDVRIDLPYSNFAYDQNGAPWPINQAVYVDYMIYDLLGHHGVSAEELLSMYRTNQEANGHVRGYANWAVYTPGMVYASAKHYLLSGDRAAFDRLLPPTLKAADWCLADVGKAKGRDTAAGLVRGPLNDLTGDGVWAFSQAYVYAGFDALAQALKRIGHPRAEEFRAAAEAFRGSVERGFSAASMRSPLVQLRDHTWTPYVPCEALSSGRRMDQWYPTDVDTGAVHLPRLKAIAPDGALADCLLNDHEDNLYLKGWGMANEPVYNQQATAYLLRDDPKAAIRAFYSYMACAYSHGVYEPVEHRWTHGQYFGPPSTDGAWMELYRNMLIQERDDDTLLLLAATPRKWLEHGKRIEIQRAPTYYGPLDITVESSVNDGRISTEIQVPDRAKPKAMVLRLRHPAGKAVRSVKVNGQDWTDFDARKEWVRIPAPQPGSYSIVVAY